MKGRVLLGILKAAARQLCRPRRHEGNVANDTNIATNWRDNTKNFAFDNVEKGNERNLYFDFETTRATSVCISTRVKQRLFRVQPAISLAPAIDKPRLSSWINSIRIGGIASAGRRRLTINLSGRCRNAWAYIWDRSHTHTNEMTELIELRPAVYFLYSQP